MAEFVVELTQAVLIIGRIAQGEQRSEPGIGFWVAWVVGQQAFVPAYGICCVAGL